MVNCFAYGCNHNSMKNSCRFFCFPSDKIQARKWEDRSRRADSKPTTNSRLCSCHFKNGIKTNEPTIFQYCNEKQFNFPSPESKKRKFNSKVSNDPNRKINTKPLSPIPSTSQQAFANTTPKRIKILVPKRFSTIPIVKNDCTIDSIDEPTTQAVADMASSSSKCNKITILSSPEYHNKILNTSSSVCDNSPKIFSPEVENLLLESQLCILKNENEALKNQKIRGKFSFQVIKSHPKSEILIRHYTGMPTIDLFLCLNSYCSRFKIKYFAGWNVTGLLLEDQLLMTLIKLRCNFAHVDLAFRFGISEATVSNITLTFIHVLHRLIFEDLITKRPTPSILKNQAFLPSSFCFFNNCKMVIDCTEIECDIPRQSMLKQKLMFSHYKQRITCKALVGISPNGAITFVSNFYVGSISDKQIVLQSGILSNFVAGDLILADKGFTIHDILPKGVSLNIPPFLYKSQFTKAEVESTRQIARARVHVERAIERIKKYHILDHIPFYYRSYATMIFQVCAALVNWQYPIIKLDDEKD